METNIKVEVHYTPNDPLGGSFQDDIVPIYRIYVDNDLITERNWIWSSDSFIDENISIHGLKNKEYTIKLECLRFQPKLFELKNLRVNGNSRKDQNNTKELSFILE